MTLQPFQIIFILHHRSISADFFCLVRADTPASTFSAWASLVRQTSSLLPSQRPERLPNERNACNLAHAGPLL
jgi:hypothetical protein